MDIATLVHDTEYKTKQSFGESDPQRLNDKWAMNIAVLLSKFTDQ
jgi:hypothetical protein